VRALARIEALLAFGACSEEFQAARVEATVQLCDKVERFRCKDLCESTLRASIDLDVRCSRHVLPSGSELWLACILDEIGGPFSARRCALEGSMHGAEILPLFTRPVWGAGSCLAQR